MKESKLVDEKEELKEISAYDIETKKEDHFILRFVSLTCEFLTDPFETVHTMKQIHYFLCYSGLW